MVFEVLDPDRVSFSLAHVGIVSRCDPLIRSLPLPLGPGRSKANSNISSFWRRKKNGENLASAKIWRWSH